MTGASPAGCAGLSRRASLCPGRGDVARAGRVAGGQAVGCLVFEVDGVGRRIPGQGNLAAVRLVRVGVVAARVSGQTQVGAGR